MADRRAYRPKAGQYSLNTSMKAQTAYSLNAGEKAQNRAYRPQSRSKGEMRKENEKKNEKRIN